MKRFRVSPIVAVALIVTAALIVIGGDSLAARILDQKLASLLTRELGLPVKLAPIHAGILRLKVSTPRLVMGDPNFSDCRAGP